MNGAEFVLNQAEFELNQVEFELNQVEFDLNQVEFDLNRAVVEFNWTHNGFNIFFQLIPDFVRKYVYFFRFLQHYVASYSNPK